jgi:Protein of unknown function (DUF998)
MTTSYAGDGIERPARSGRGALTSAAGLDGASLSQTAWLLVLGGTLGGLLFTTVYSVEGATREGYNAAANAISVLSLGPGGEVQQANFVLFGVLILASSWGWRRLLAPGTGAAAYPCFRALAGLGLIIDGFMSQDPIPGYPPGTSMIVTTLHGQIHSAAAFVVILGLATSDFVLAKRFAAEPDWRSWSSLAIAAGAITIAFIGAFGAMGANGGVAGICERLAGGANSVLGVAVVTRLMLQRGQERRQRHRAARGWDIDLSELTGR